MRVGVIWTAGEQLFFADKQFKKRRTLQGRAGEASQRVARGRRARSSRDQATCSRAARTPRCPRQTRTDGFARNAPTRKFAGAAGRRSEHQVGTDVTAKGQTSRRAFPFISAVALSKIEVSVCTCKSKNGHGNVVVLDSKANDAREGAKLLRTRSTASSSRDAGEKVEHRRRPLRTARVS